MEPNKGNDNPDLSGTKRYTALLMRLLGSLGVEMTPKETQKLQFLAERKYNRYDIFSPGETFQNRLLQWLENFEKKDRTTAMELVKCLIFVNQYEMKQLARTTFERIVATFLDETADVSSMNWSTYIDSRNQKASEKLSKSIFIAIADDVMFDYFRRYAEYRNESLNKDNFVEYYKLDPKSKENLPHHDRLFLIDQLSGSGNTLIRWKADSGWVGKIPRIEQIWTEEIREQRVYYCPYLQSSVASQHLQKALPKWSSEVATKFPIQVMPTCRIPVAACLSSDGGRSVDDKTIVAALCRKYHHKFVEDEHIATGGPPYYGYGSAGLALVLFSNCPNNSPPLLWHSNQGWFPLFPRVKHHRQVALYQ